MLVAAGEGTFVSARQWGGRVVSRDHGDRILERVPQMFFMDSA